MAQASGMVAAIVEQRKRGTEVAVLAAVMGAEARGVAVMVVCGNWPAPLCQSER